ncbi:hypothetical protein [Parafrankia soli]|uniref:hypothetical protein n=1 Tax=Parafrankia soli TaxID=2599596 RepID=UPI0018E30E83|nr:hypothetical protein [Parafrankia soli]
MEGGWISGGCSGSPEPSRTLPFRILHMQCDFSVAEMEELEAKLIACRNRLPVESVEYAALMERIENVTEEARWIRDLLAKIAGREERNSERRPPGASGPTPS